MGELTRREIASVRAVLFDSMESNDVRSLCVDVRDVALIDRAGIAMLLGASYRAAALGRTFVVRDRHGAVTSALAHLHLHGRLVVQQVDSLVL